MCAGLVYICDVVHTVILVVMKITVSFEAKLLSKNLIEAVGFTAIVSEEGCVTIRGFGHESFPVNISFLI